MYLNLSPHAKSAVNAAYRLAAEHGFDHIVPEEVVCVMARQGGCSEQQKLFRLLETPPEYIACVLYCSTAAGGRSRAAPPRSVDQQPAVDHGLRNAEALALLYQRRTIGIIHLFMGLTEESALGRTYNSVIEAGSFGEEQDTPIDIEGSSLALTLKKECALPLNRIREKLGFSSDQAPATVRVLRSLATRAYPQSSIEELERSLSGTDNLLLGYLLKQ